MKAKVLIGVLAFWLFTVMTTETTIGKVHNVGGGNVIVNGQSFYLDRDYEEGATVLILEDNEQNLIKDMRLK